MNFDDALASIDGIDGAGSDLGERTPVWPDFPIEEYRRRYARLSALMDAQGLDVLVLTQEEAVRYLSGYNSVVWAVGRWLPTVLVAARDPRQAVLIAAQFDAGCAAGTAWVAQVDTYHDADELPAKVAGHLAAIGAGPRRAAFELSQGSFMALPQQIVTAITGSLAAPPRDASRIISALRMARARWRSIGSGARSAPPSPGTGPAWKRSRPG